MKIRALLCAPLACASIVLLPPDAHALWGDTNCTGSMADVPVSATTRGNARAFMAYVEQEGYHWSGGCANTNNVDDAPGQVPETASPRGEGPDCSGLVYRTWGLGQSSGTTQFYTHYQYGYVHGPYRALSFRTSTTAWTVVSKSAVGYMDTLASTFHVGLYQGGNADGTANYFEAKQESVGSGVFARTYRSDSAYIGAHRNGWTG